MRMRGMVDRGCMFSLPTYPVDEVSSEVSTSLSRREIALLSTPPGSGKTTILPLKLIGESWLAGQNILLIQPRRLAARNVAIRMAELIGEKIGETVGYRVRLENRVSARTKIEVMTEGVLLRRIQNEPELSGVGLVILDEFHERSLNTDLSWVLLNEIIETLRPDLRILLMSATVQTGRFTALDRVKVITGGGTLFPVEVRELDAAAPERIPSLTASAVRSALVESSGNVLVFLPGRREIRKCAELLQGIVSKDIAVEELFGELAYADQQRVILPDKLGRRKIILSTPVAETSVTIEGVTAVVDSGYEKITLFDPGRGGDRLVLQRISEESAAQRTGRAGRLMPGISYRLWRGPLGNQTRVPEILRTDLSSLVLELSAWGTTDIAALPWLDAPPGGAFRQAVSLLTDLGFLDEGGGITPLGRVAATLPVSPRHARMLLAAGGGENLQDACLIATLLEERDFLNERDVSIDHRLDLLKRFRDSRSVAQAADRRALERILVLAGNLHQAVLRNRDRERVQSEGLLDAGELLAHAYPDRIGKRRAGVVKERRYLLSSGISAELPPNDALQKIEYLVVADYSVRNEDSLIRLAAAISEESIRALFASKILREERLEWTSDLGGVRAERIERYGAVRLTSQVLAASESAALTRAFLEGVRAHGGLSLLPWSGAAEELRGRMAAYSRFYPESGAPAVSDEVLLETLEEWLGPYVSGMNRAIQLEKLDVAGILLSRYSWQEQKNLEVHAPAIFLLPSGKQRKISYDAEGGVLSATVQELFGFSEAGVVGRSRIPFRFEILSPARRPIQVTKDLGSFWKNTYTDVRKELRGRYPKHDWPEDPIHGYRKRERPK